MILSIETFYLKIITFQKSNVMNDNITLRDKKLAHENTNFIKDLSSSQKFG